MLGGPYRASQDALVLSHVPVLRCYPIGERPSLNQGPLGRQSLEVEMDEGQSQVGPALVVLLVEDGAHGVGLCRRASVANLEDLEVVHHGCSYWSKPYPGG